MNEVITVIINMSPSLYFITEKYIPLGNKNMLLEVIFNKFYLFVNGF